MKSEYLALSNDGLKKILADKQKSVDRINFRESLYKSPEGEFFVQEIREKKKSVIDSYKDIRIDSPSCQLMLGVLQSEERFFNELLANIENLSLYKKMVSQDIKEINDILANRKRDLGGDHMIPTNALKKKE